MTAVRLPAHHFAANWAAINEYLAAQTIVGVLCSVTKTNELGIRFARLPDGPDKEEAFLGIAKSFHPYLMKYLEMIIRGRVPTWGTDTHVSMPNPGSDEVPSVLRQEGYRTGPDSYPRCVRLSIWHSVTVWPMVGWTPRRSTRSSYPFSCVSPRSTTLIIPRRSQRLSTFSMNMNNSNLQLHSPPGKSVATWTLTAIAIAACYAAAASLSKQGRKKDEDFDTARAPETGRHPTVSSTQARSGLRIIYRNGSGSLYNSTSPTACPNSRPKRESTPWKAIWKPGVDCIDQPIVKIFLSTIPGGLMIPSALWRRLFSAAAVS
jgi:hypothetical protein